MQPITLRETPSGAAPPTNSSPKWQPEHRSINAELSTGKPGASIVLATLNAKYIHAAFGLRYLLANMGELRAQTAMREFDINQRPLDVAESILALNPTIVGLGVYIWNVAPATELISILKSARPELTIVIGGPEVSFECDRQEIVRLADYVITGEADLAFAQLCRQLIAGEPPPLKIIAAPLPTFADAGAAVRLVR